MNDIQRSILDTEIQRSLGSDMLSMDEIVARFRSRNSSFSVCDVKTRVLQLIPSTIELTRDLDLKIV